MVPQSTPSNTPETIRQPLAPEDIDPAQQQAHLEAVRSESAAMNPGDRVDSSKSLLEKAQQVAANVADITGEQVVVPTYFVTDEPDGSHRALHHVRDAEDISDVIRQARVDTETGDRQWW